MKNKQKLGKFCPELDQKFTVFSKTFLGDSFTFGLHEFHNHLIST